MRFNVLYCKWYNFFEINSSDIKCARYWDKLLQGFHIGSSLNFFSESPFHLHSEKHIWYFFEIRKKENLTKFVMQMVLLYLIYRSLYRSPFHMEPYDMGVVENTKNIERWRTSRTPTIQIIWWSIGYDL